MQQTDSLISKQISITAKNRWYWSKAEQTIKWIQIKFQTRLRGRMENETLLVKHQKGKCNAYFLLYTKLDEKFSLVILHFFLFLFQRW